MNRKVTASKVTPDDSTARSAEDHYIRALRFRWLTPFYDTIVAATTRERVFKTALLEQAAPPSGSRVLDLGCGTGTRGLGPRE